MTAFTATYSPDDNKLRLYAASRLDAETYARVKAAGFKWAPKQDLFVAPAWTPEREDLLLELAGEIGDEDTSLVDRAEQRAERFETYSDKRMSEAESARVAVARIADGIPLGQPILVGHHSERHARRDAERIENGMRKAVSLWKTSKYWTTRANGAIRHAKYKELPPVRARRVKGLEADRRKQERAKADAEKWLRVWSRVDLTIEQARFLANHCHLTVVREGAHRWSAWDVLRPDDERYSACPAWTVDQVRAAALDAFPSTIAHCERWIAHLDNRLSYERAMLTESGWTAPPKPTTPADLPLLNYPGTVSYRNPYTGDTVTRDAVHITKAEFAKIHTDYKGTRVSACGTHRVRTAVHVPGHAAALVTVFLSDSKQHARPGEAAIGAKAAEETAAAEQAADANARRLRARLDARDAAAPDRAAEAAKDAPFEALRGHADAGVQVAVAPQLFPTPPELARRLVEAAGVQRGHRVLEPSAGTGALIEALRAVYGGAYVLTAVEINSNLCDRLRRVLHVDDVHQADFLTWSRGSFDRIVANPPFERGDDIRHIRHALTMLAPAGVLVALCADGPRQQEQLRPMADTWEEIPAGTFDGTNVRTALLTITRADATL